VAFLFAGTVRADVMNLPMPADYVTDDAGVVSAGEKAQLNGLLQELERKTGAQVIILTVKSLEGNPIETVSLHLAHDLWKLGQKGKDNGLLILISTGDRKYRISGAAITGWESLRPLMTSQGGSPEHPASNCRRCPILRLPNSRRFRNNHGTGCLVS
jgi:hypothetical protein